MLKIWKLTLVPWPRLLFQSLDLRAGPARGSGTKDLADLNLYLSPLILGFMYFN